MTQLQTPDTELPSCRMLDTGRESCTARFDRKLYQLAIRQDGNEETLDLGFSGSRVLERLLEIPGKVVSREELMAHAWEGRVVGQGSLNQQIYMLRQALFDSRNQIIQTLPRRGYLFNPQYLIGEQAEPTNNATDASAPELAEPLLFELRPSVLTMKEQPISARRRPSWQTLGLAGSGMMMLLGLAALGFRLVSPSMPSFTHTVDVGVLDVLYVEESQRLLDTLINETRHLVDTMADMSAEPARLIVNMSPGFYEVRCLQNDGQVNWLKVHKSQIQTIPSDHLEECLQ